MSLGTNRITSFGHQAVYTVPAGKRATVNTTIHANSAAPLVGIAANALGSYPSSTAVTDPAALFYTNTGSINDVLGYRVAMDGNYAVATSNANAGFIRVYFFNGTSWTVQQTINDPNTSGNSFGASVDISGDRILVGAPNNSQSGNSGEGRAYLYTRSGTTWTLANTYTYGSWGSQAGAAFGSQVAFGGTNVYISAVSSNYNTGQTAGAVFRYSNYTTASNAYASPSGTGGDQFGNRLIAWPNGVWAASSSNGLSGRGWVSIGTPSVIQINLYGDAGTNFNFGRGLGGNIKSTSTSELFMGVSVGNNAGFGGEVRLYRILVPNGTPQTPSLVQTIASAANTIGIGNDQIRMWPNGDLALGNVGSNNNTSTIVLYTKSQNSNNWSQSSTITTPSGLNLTSLAVGTQSGTTAIGNNWTVNTLMATNAYQLPTNSGEVYIYGNAVATASVADSTAFVSNFGLDRTTLTANQTFERTGMVLDAGESVVVANLGGGDIVAQVRGYEENV